MDNRRIAERYVQALEARDIGMHADLMHPEVVIRYPQSGEVFRGAENCLRMLKNYPGGLPEGHATSIEDDVRTAVLAPSMPFMKSTIVTYGGNRFILQGVARYPEGDYFFVGLFRLDGGLVIEETWYFAAPFDPPDWRRPYVEP